MDVSKEIIDDAIDFRRELHRNPELSTMEQETSRRIREQLEKLGIPYKDEVAEKGIFGIMKGKNPGRTVGFGGDIEALPIDEMSGEVFSSEIPVSCMHVGMMPILRC